jgi:hypothetical protein
MESWNAPYLNNYYKYITIEMESLLKSPQIGRNPFCGGLFRKMMFWVHGI